MSIAVHPLAGLRERLQATVAGDEVDRLRDLLGLDLPALGGQQEPADTLLQAVHYPTFDSALAEGLAELMGRVLSDESLAAELVSASELLEGDLEDLVFNALALANQLPANPTLFEALQELAPLLEDKSFETPDHPPLERLLRRALIYQQTDDSLESQWLGLIDQLGRATTKGGLSVQERTLLLDAWRGLLWIPPPGTPEEDSSVINFERLDKGLTKISATLTEREDREQAGRRLERVLRILSDSFPRSPEFWARRLKPFYASWPEALQVSAARLWPPVGCDIGQIAATHSEALHELFRLDARQVVQGLNATLRYPYIESAYSAEPWPLQNPWVSPTSRHAKARSTFPTTFTTEGAEESEPLLRTLRRRTLRGNVSHSI